MTSHPFQAAPVAVARAGRSRGGRTVAVAFVALLASGCATLPAPAPRAGGQGTTPSGRGRTPVTAVVDSGPSAEASAVLATIPEPLAPSERVPPPTREAPTSSPAAGTPGTPPDSAVGTADSVRSSVPVPAPTTPLGAHSPPATTAPPAGSVPPASTPPASSAAPSEAPPASATPPRTPAASDTCWRVQVAAPTEIDKAEQVRSTAESVLLVPMVVEPEAGRFKVRTRGCMDRVAADQMRARALTSGFEGSFRLIWKAP